MIQLYGNFHIPLHMCLLFWNRYLLIQVTTFEQNAISTVTSKFSVLPLTRNARDRHFYSNENVFLSKIEKKNEEEYK